jgi:hypothetical protein
MRRCGLSASFFRCGKYVDTRRDHQGKIELSIAARRKLLQLDGADDGLGS